LNLQSGASLTALGGADFSALKDLRVQSDATLLAEASSKFDNLKDIANFGMITSKVRLDKLDSIYNSPTATLQFLERAKVRGRIVTKNDKAAIPAMASLPEGKIGIFNEGKILTKIKLKPGEIFDPKAVDFFGVDVKSGNYAASKDAIFRMESGGIRANDFINDGLLYSPTRLKFWQYGHVTKWGRGAAEDGIEYEIDTSSPFKLDDTFKPIINGPKKELKIISKGGLEISKPLNMDVDLNIETPVFNGNENLTVRSFKAKTTTFNNTKILSAKDFIDIETTNFTNTSGKLQTHGDGRIKVNGLFRNTGGGTLEKNVPETITNYIWNGSGAVPEEMVFLRDIYKPELDKAGVITCGGLLDIFAGKFDNSFGILNAARKIEIKSLKEICNECGLICSGGPAILNGTLLKNGYMKGSESVAGVDPNVPIKTPQSVPYQIWVSSGYERHNGMWPFGSDEWIDTSHAETRWRHDLVITNYQAKTQHTSIAQYPGYIFSNGDLELQMDSDAYLGTIVSGGDIYIKGTKQENINFADRGLLIARGNVTAELEKAALAQLAIQAQNIFINLTQELLIRDIVQPLLMPDGSVSQLINLQKLGRQFGMLTDGSTFAEQGFSFPSPTGLVPTNISSFGGFSVHQTAEAGFLGPKPSTKFFMSELQDSILNQLITLTLTPIYGRDILLKIDLAGQLRKTGAVLGEAFRGSQEIVLRGGDPAILFDKSTNLDVEVEVEGEKALIPLYNPYLLTDAVSRFLNKIQAEKLLHVQSLENIHLEPGQINLESEHLTLESKKQIQIAAEFVYNETGNRIGVNPVSLTRPGTITLSGDKGVETKGAQLSAKKLQVRSSEGNVVDMNMPLDPVYTFLAPRTGLFFKTPKTVLMRQEAVTSSFHGEDGITFSAPKGTIWQSGTELAAGEDGIVFDSKSYLWQPAFQRSGVYCSDSRGFSSNEIKFPKASLTYTPGAIVYKTKDATLMGARIVAGTISNPVDGTFRAAPAYATQESHSYTSKSGFMGLGRSSLEIRETRKTPEPTQIITDHFASLGVGTCEFEGAVVKALDVAITKNLSEKAAYERVHTVVTQKSSGFFAPKIKGDPFVDALRGVRGVVTFGDVAPAAFNLIGATAQTLNHAQMLANLSTIGNPFSTVAQILTNRFMTGPVYSNIKTVTEVKESKPLQSRIETGILRVVNDRTHLEGIWNVTGRAAIETKTLTTAAPKHEISQKTETSGWSISLSPAALLTAGLAFVTPVGIGLTETLGCLPNVAVHDSDGNASSTTYAQQVLTAGDLFVRCDNAVFSGSTIHAKTLEMIVSGDLTVETLANTFHSESSSRDFGLCLGAIASLTQDVKVDNRFVDPRLGAVPTIRIADEEALSVKVQQLAKIVGTERFYLTVGGLLHKKSAEVGLKPDGVVVRNDAERIQAGRVLEEKVREVESHSRRVINPAVGEFVAMMSQVDEFKQLRAQIAAQQMINGVPREERKRTDEAIMRTAQREEANVSRVAEETIAVNDQLNQKLKSTIGEGEITKLTSGKPVSAKTRASIAKEVSGAIDDIQAKKEEIAGNSSTGSNEFEQSIIAASKETQLGILNDRIGIYQQLLFALSRSPEPPTITRLKEGLGAVTGIVVDNCRAAESMTYEQYKTYQMQKMPEGARSDPEVIDIVGTSYFVNKGLAKIGQGIGKVFGAIDDATGNVFSDWMRKLSDGIDSTFEKVEREMISGGTPEVIAQNLADIGNISTQIFAPGAIGKAGVAIAGVTKLRGAMLGAVTKSTATVIDGSKIGMSWFGNWFDRGYAFEKFLETLFPGAKLPDRFKTFDFFRIENQVARTGTAISAKTLDTNTLSRIANPNLVRYKINGYINEMLNFTEHRLEGLKLTSPQITARELHLAIPANTSPIHMQQIENCIQYGIDNKVKVVITKVK
jgi:hypothetical protein